MKVTTRLYLVPRLRWRQSTIIHLFLLNAFLVRIGTTLLFQLPINVGIFLYSFHRLVFKWKHTVSSMTHTQIYIYIYIYIYILTYSMEQSRS